MLSRENSIVFGAKQRHDSMNEINLVNNESHEEMLKNVKQYYGEHMRQVSQRYPASPVGDPPTDYWDYEMHGDDWGCGGDEQSPIDIVDTDVVPQLTHYLKVWWNIQPITVKVEDNGHTIFAKATVSRMVGTTPDDERRNALYEAVQFHFHTPSEHTVNGNHYALEMHIVHAISENHFRKSPSRNLAVFAIFFEVDDSAPSNKFFESLRLDRIDPEDPVVINMYDAFGMIEEPEFYGYVGSLTTPPCSEVVNWYIMKEPLKITTEQLNLFHFGQCGNNRHTQQLFNRTVYCGNCNALKKFHTMIKSSSVPEITLRTTTTETKSGLQVISFDDFRSVGSFPQYARDKDLLQSLNKIDTRRAINIYISHAWILTDDEEETPDNVYNENYYLCVEAIELVMHITRQSRCYIWIDCACMDPDVEEAKPLWEIMEFADCMLTPVLGDDVFSLDAFTGRYSYFSDYHAHLFNGCPSSYMNRATTRMDMLYAAAVPITQAQLDRSKHFGYGMQIAMMEGRRPHLLFGSREKREGSLPLYLPPLQFSYLQLFYPTKGYCHSPYISMVIAAQMEEIEQYILPPVNTFNNFPVVSDSRIYGEGERIYPNGDRYRGNLSQGKRQGKGIYFYSGGETCEGEWDSGMSCGHANILRSDGSTYEGEVLYDTLHGAGIMSYSNGDVYDGPWKWNKRHGQNAKYRWSSGAVYVGGYFEGQFHGEGIFTSANGIKYDGVWRHGVFLRSFTYPLEKETQWLTDFIMHDMHFIQEKAKFQKIASQNASFRLEHCGHMMVQPQHVPEVEDDEDDAKGMSEKRRVKSTKY